MKRVSAQILIAVLLSTVAYSQNGGKLREIPNKTYWLKYPLIYFKSCAPRVSPDNIIFTEGNCEADSPYSGKIIPKGAEVELNSAVREKGFAKVTFKWASSSYEVLLKNDSEKTFRKSFDLLFAMKELGQWYDTDCPSGIKTKKQLVQCIGFPIRAKKEGNVEHYFYILEFAGPGNPYSSYDGFTVMIDHGKIVSVSGYI